MMSKSKLVFGLIALDFAYAAVFCVNAFSKNPPTDWREVIIVYFFALLCVPLLLFFLVILPQLVLKREREKEMAAPVTKKVKSKKRTGGK